MLSIAVFKKYHKSNSVKQQKLLGHISVCQKSSTTWLNSLLRSHLGLHSFLETHDEFPSKLIQVVDRIQPFAVLELMLLFPRWQV